MTKPGMTTWEMVKASLHKKEVLVPAELKIFNPFELKNGDFVGITGLDLALRDLGKFNFKVVKVDEYDLTIGAVTYRLTDYVLYDSALEEWVTLRAIPRENNSKGRDALLLFPHKEIGWDKKLGEEMSKAEYLYTQILPTGELPIDTEGEDEKYTPFAGVYQRRFDILDPYYAVVTEVDEKGQTTTSRLCSWDYERTDEHGRQVFYFVEMDADTGRFQTFGGMIVFEDDVHPIRRLVKK